MPGVTTWLVAFWELRTERLFELGPIPQSAIRAYPKSEAEAQLFDEAMRAADAAYLAIASKPKDVGSSDGQLPVATGAVLRK